ncbi:MAG: hypothetical protein JNL82_19240 [Myxococcales bacterium]|nr:hypothetical protein [Myxococcales bacterium]
MPFACGLVSAACDADEATRSPAEVAADERQYEDNGFRLNGFRLNGFRLNGFRLNGAVLGGDDGSGAWIVLNHLSLAGEAPVTKSWLAGSDLHVELSGGAVLAGEQLTGAVLEFVVADGSGSDKQVTTVRIDGVEPLEPGSDVWLYDLVVSDEKSVWEPLCVDGDGEPTGAILLGDVWDPDSGDRVVPRPSGAVTFACRDAALAKCVEWGYAPWRSVDDVALADHHQACTRAVRADYCGDGTPHTVDGLTVHFIDDLGVQVADESPPYLVEAEWGPDGALCIEPDNTRLPDPAITCGDLPPCGETFASGGLVQTGVPAE